jgi:hypothetical protein
MPDPLEPLRKAVETTLNEARRIAAKAGAGPPLAKASNGNGHNARLGRHMARGAVRRSFFDR